MQPLVSIIIPTYNRAHLLGETLDSVLAQTYQNWECIVVDDGSEDHTQELLKQYRKKDNRFAFFERPSEKPKGANACRNIGLQNATGTYIIFFDSDDLMTPDHVAVKMNVLTEGTYDYVIAKTKNFDGYDAYMEGRYRFIENKLTAENYILQKINCLTYDTCIKAALAKSIRFNEALQSGQEYNYFSKLVLKSVDACFIEKYLTLRRVHEKSIRSGLKVRTKKMVSAYVSCWITYLDIKEDASKQIRKGLLFRCVDMLYKNREQSFPFQTNLTRMVFKEFGIWEGLNFIMMKIANRYLKKGYSFRKQIARNIETNSLSK
ncbi:MAG: hypothetical protein CMC13_06970 [Flavobacteriaceae bacterium]|nr:hypothetical protein [Flavobacteriaceae bacterium]